jgi:hypothetical protein
MMGLAAPSMSRRASKMKEAGNDRVVVLLAVPVLVAFAVFADQEVQTFLSVEAKVRRGDTTPEYAGWWHQGPGARELWR